MQGTALLTDTLTHTKGRFEHPGETLFNPGLARWRDGLVCITRRCNLQTDRDKVFSRPAGESHNASNRMHFLNAAGELLRAADLDDSLTRRLAGVADAGLEDIRLFTVNGVLYGIGAGVSMVQGRVHATQMLLKFDGERVVGQRHLPSPNGAVVEKNWVPLLGQDRVFLLYGLDPVVCFDATGPALKLVKGRLPRNNLSMVLRGGTPFVALGDCFLSVAHFAPLHLDKVYYRHCFVVLDRQLNCIEQSEPFFIQRRGIEFAVGLVLQGDQLTLSYGVADRAARCISFHRRELEKLIVTVS